MPKKRGPYDSRRPEPKPLYFNANFVKKYRKRVKWTQGKLAEKADVSTGTISGIESGDAGFSMESLDAVSHALGWPRGMLLDFDPTDKSDSELRDLAKKMAGRKK